jgi:signal transduction histidine kinase
MNFADRLFAPFQRLHPASAYEGNGIGLALIQRVVRRHGGRVWLQSSPEQGTQAFVRLWESGQQPAES